MNPIVLSRHWQLMLMSLVLLFAVLTRYGGPRQSPTNHLPGAMLIPLEVLAAHLPKLEAAKAQPIVVYCGNGTTRGPRAAHLLTQAGFAHVMNLEGGFEGWLSYSKRFTTASSPDQLIAQLA